MTGPILLCADDYAMTEGVSRGIEDLAAAGCLSATSAMTGMRHWPARAARIRELSGEVAVGLHFNLTLGEPLGPMPRLAPSGRLPLVGELVTRAVKGDIDTAEIEAETLRQLDAFEAAFGAPPDFLDGHQHVHALPRVRTAVLAALRHRYAGRQLLIRDPSTGVAAAVRMGVATAKSMLLTGLSTGFARAVREAGFMANEGFAGVSAFETGVARAELTQFSKVEGRFPIVMCHPGFADAELASLDPLTARREEELAVLTNRSPFADRLWRPVRSSSGAIDWKAAMRAARP